MTNLELYKDLQVGGRDVMLLDERALLVNDLVDTKVGVEVRLDVLEEGD